MTCPVSDCDRQVRARGVCLPHYARWRRLLDGDPSPPPSEMLDVLAEDRTPTGYPYGSRTVRRDGYVLVKVGRLHPVADHRGWALEHRLVAADKLGRPLEPGERVTHVNGIRDDNRPSNLAVT